MRPRAGRIPRGLVALALLAALAGPVEARPRGNPWDRLRPVDRPRIAGIPEPVPVEAFPVPTAYPLLGEVIRVRAARGLLVIAADPDVPGAAVRELPAGTALVLRDARTLAPVGRARLLGSRAGSFLLARLEVGLAQPGQDVVLDVRE